jgi:hypothetical protein
VEDPNTRTPLGQLAVVYRQGLRVLLRIPVDIRVELIYILTLRWPVVVALAKATWRYYRRIQGMVAAPYPPPIGLAARWTRGIETGGYTLSKGLTWCERYESITAIYREAA